MMSHADQHHAAALHEATDRILAGQPRDQVRRTIRDDYRGLWPDELDDLLDVALGRATDPRLDGVLLDELDGSWAA